MQRLFHCVIIAREYPERTKIMRKRTRILICWLVLLLSSPAGAGEPSKIEELEKRLKTVSGVEAARVSNELAAEYRKFDLDKALGYWRKAFFLAKAVDEPDELFSALNGIGVWNHINEQYRDAISYYLKALELEPRIKDKQKIPNVITNIGIVYWNLGNFVLSEQYHTRALELRKKLGYTPELMGHTLNNLGLALQGKGEFQKALDYFHQALEFQEKANNKRGEAAALTNIANCFGELKKYPAAFEYFQKALGLYKEIDYRWGVANSTLGLGRLLIYMEKYDSALPYLESALEKARAIGAKDVLRDLYQDFSRVYEAKQDFKKALKFHRQFIDLKEKLMEEKNRQNSSVLKVKYETEKKGVELLLLQKTQHKETLAHYFLAAGIFLFIGLIIALHYRIITGKRLNRQLQLSEAKYRLLFDQAGDAIFLLDGPVYMDCNQKALELFDVTRDQVIGRTFADFSPPSQPDGRDSMKAFMGYIIQTQEGTSRQFHWLHRKRDGSLFDAEVNLSMTAIGGKKMIQAFVHDISFSRRLENERVKSAQLETLGLVAAGIVHDFNNLLADVKDNLEIIKTQALPGKISDTYLPQVGEALVATEQLVEKFLTISEGGSLPMETLPIDALIRESAGSMLKDTGGGVNARVITAENLWRVDYNKNQVDRLIRNIIQNSLDAIKSGGDIEIAADNVEKDGKRYVLVTISDTGEGICPEHLPKIFDPYFTTRDHVTRKGLGMGLTVARAIAARHGGMIDITSEPGKGATCRIYLPASGQDLRG